MEEEKKDRLNLLFAKANLVNERKNEIAGLNVDITNLLYNWYDNHKEEIENDLGEEEPVRWLGQWSHNQLSEYIKLTLIVGCGDDSYYRRLGLYPDGHWEYIPF